jgi:hypothetical protein
MSTYYYIICEACYEQAPLGENGLMDSTVSYYIRFICYFIEKHRKCNNIKITTEQCCHSKMYSDIIIPNDWNVWLIPEWVKYTDSGCPESLL